jgi:hypothetical protein
MKDIIPEDVKFFNILEQDIHTLHSSLHIWEQGIHKIQFSPNMRTRHSQNPVLSTHEDKTFTNYSLSKHENKTQITVLSTHDNQQSFRVQNMFLDLKESRQIGATIYGGKCLLTVIPCMNQTEMFTLPLLVFPWGSMKEDLMNDKPPGSISSCHSSLEYNFILILSGSSTLEHRQTIEWRFNHFNFIW